MNGSCYSHFSLRDLDNDFEYRNLKKNSRAAFQYYSSHHKIKMAPRKGFYLFSHVTIEDPLFASKNWYVLSVLYDSSSVF